MQSRQIEYVPVTSLQVDPRNPKAHDEELINQSINRFGVLDIIVRDERTGYIVSGHGRHKAFMSMMARGETAPDGVRVDENGEWLIPVVTGWSSRSDSEAGAALIALNRTSEVGGWVDDSLLELLDDLSEFDGGLEGVGFSDIDMEALQDLVDSVDDIMGDLDEGSTPVEDDEELQPTGQHFKDLDVLYGEPEHVVRHGEKYLIGGRHLLVVAKLAREHHLWSHLLEGRVFAPYPDVYYLLGDTPKEEEHLFVQPNIYLAGHMLDKWASVHGKETIKLIQEEV